MPTDLQDQALRSALRFRADISRRCRYLLGLERRLRLARGRSARGLARNELWAAIHQLDPDTSHAVIRQLVEDAVKNQPPQVAEADMVTAAVHDSLNRPAR